MCARVGVPTEAAAGGMLVACCSARVGGRGRGEGKQGYLRSGSSFYYTVCTYVLTCLGDRRIRNVQVTQVTQNTTNMRVPKRNVGN